MMCSPGEARLGTVASATMHPPLRLKLSLTSRPENVAVIRAVLSGVSATAGLSREQTIDLKTAVSEAANNVCLHAYPDAGSGPMLVEIDLTAHGIAVALVDEGCGITRVSSRSGRMGLGLALINALADTTEFRRAAGGGADVRMQFNWSLPGLDAPAEDPGAASAPTVQAQNTPADDLGEAAEVHGQVVLWCHPSQVQRHVLLRLLTYLAATAYFSVTSLEHLADVNAGIAREVDRSGDGWIGVGIDPEPRRLHITIGPLLGHGDHGDADLAAIVESLQSEPLDGSSKLSLTVADRGD
jgi:anti-sigma regulatory factor (Ser/Thr protein kinase)